MIPKGRSAPNYLHQRWLFYSMIHSFLISVSLSDPRITEAGLYCGNSRAASSYVPTFVQGMESLSNVIANSHFATSHVNSTPPIYALAQCHHDLSQTDCLLCYAASRTRIPRCLPSFSGRLYLDGCFLRYDNYSFYQEFVSSYFDKVTCSNKTVSGSGNKNKSFEFETSVVHVVSNVTSKALENDGFGAVGIGGVYALAQCWDSVGKEGCRQCLEAAAEAAKGCLPKREGRGMNAGCYLRYSTEKFYGDGESSGNSHGSSGTGVTVAIVLAISAALMISLFAAYTSYIKLSKLKEVRNNLGKISISFDKSSHSFKYETLEKATDYFSPLRRLGQGGGGSVFMGALPDGQTVAVKRLIFNTRQWVDDFFNEVNLISRIQHKNLVRLLGCSIEGPESLLVYEYVPNKSLDRFLFGNYLPFTSFQMHLLS
uniref:Cysteine-rich receptor-like protein kinase 42 n=1 Tax=Rhizophora mucronata TaxID=61149 RepID=A0A2P2K1W5_RHIMU